jgi:hypothetical protein
VCCDSAGFAAERAQLRDSTLPRLAELLQRRDIALEVSWSAEESEDPGAQLLSAELRLLEDRGSLLLCVLGGSYGPSVEVLPAELERSFPQLLPYQGRSRTELLCRYAMAAADPGRMIFMLRTEPPGAGSRTPVRAEGLMGTVRASRAVVLTSERSDGLVTPSSRRAEQAAAELDDFGHDALAALWHAVLNRNGRSP